MSAAPAGGPLSGLLRKQVLLFAVAGLARTVLGYLLYLLLLRFLPYWLAFTTCYVATLAFSFYLNGRYVFEASVTARRAIRYVLIYCINYLLSLGVLMLAVEVLYLGPVVAPLCVIAVMFPVNFLAERFALTK